MKKVKLIILIFIAGVFTTTSCEFGDINTDPTALAKSSLKDQLPNVMGQTVFNVGGSGSRGIGLIMQQFKGLDAQQISMMNYVMDGSTFNNLWSFGMYGAGSMSAANVLISQAIEEEQPYYVGIAKICMAVNLGIATDSWGEVPYSDAFLGEGGDEFLQPKFDTMEECYNSIQSLLDEAITELSSAPVAGGPGSDDLIYGGDADSWILTARALKARYYMHLIKRDASAASKALPLLQATYTSNSDESMFTEFGGQGTVDANPYGQFGDQRPNTLGIMESFNEKMDAKSDPRISEYMAYDGNNWMYFTSSTGLFWSSYTSPIPLISYTEVMFLTAEALLTSDVAGSEAALAAAITANMEQMGISSADYSAYVTSFGSYSGLTTDAERLERIINEKYFALYAQSFTEIWCDYRRTGYPTLTPNPVGANGSDPSGIIPQRWLYALDEIFSNTVSVDEAIIRQGPDLLDTYLWAYKD